MAEMEEASVDAVVCDPPYGFSREPDIAEVLTHWLAGDDYQHRGGGFMGQSWDSFVPGPAHWTAAFRVLKPGGHLLAFAGSRTSDLMGVAIRFAGFEIRDSIMWLYGSGFPKSLDVSKAIDKAARGVPQGGEDPTSPNHGRFKSGCSPDNPSGRGFGAGPGAFMDPSATPPSTASERTTAPSTPITEDPSAAAASGQPTSTQDATAAASPNPDAAQWDGWGTALKPAHEPIVVARKPLIGTVAQNVLEHGTGGINVDASRIEGPKGAPASPSESRGVYGNFNGRGGEASAERRYSESGGTNIAAAPGPRDGDPAGRFPANVVLSHAEDCEQVGVVSVQSDGHYPACGGKGKVAYGRRDGYEGNERHTAGETVEAWECAPGCPVAELDRQSGRLQSGRRAAGVRTGMGFHGADGDGGPAIAGDSGGASRFFYCAKTSRAERNAGLEGFEERQPRTAMEGGERVAEGRTAAPGHPEPAPNVHPTVKPINLMRWLVRLVTPPGGTILDPFIGSGTTGCAAALEGFNFIGIEREPEYIAIAEARIAFWSQHEGREVEDVLKLHSKSTKAAKEHEDRGQGDLLALASEISGGGLHSDDGR